MRSQTGTTGNARTRRPILNASTKMDFVRLRRLSTAIEPVVCEFSPLERRVLMTSPLVAQYFDFDGTGESPTTWLTAGSQGTTSGAHSSGEIYWGGGSSFSLSISSAPEHTL